MAYKVLYGFTSSKLVPGLGLRTQSSVGCQPGGEDAQINRQFPNSVTSAKGCMGGGGARPGSPEKGPSQCSFYSTRAVLQDKGGQDKRMKGGACWAEGTAWERCGGLKVHSVAEDLQLEPRVCEQGCRT